MIQTKSLALIFTKPLLIFAAAMAPFAFGISSAQELTLLTIQDDRIGEIESLDADISAKELIQSYYGLLSTQTQHNLHEYDELLDSLIIAYDVALTAADSAEITEVISDMDNAWIEIKRVHHEKFSPSVIQQLHFAYGKLYPLQ